MSDTYIISGSEPLSLRRHDGEDGPYYIAHFDARTITVSATLAEQLMRGIMALRSGQFSRACTENYLEIESRRSSSAPDARAHISSFLKPELDAL